MEDGTRRTEGKTNGWTERIREGGGLLVEEFKVEFGEDRTWRVVWRWRGVAGEVKLGRDGELKSAAKVEGRDVSPE